MKIRIPYLALLGLIFLAACEPQVIELDLPEYQTQLVVEGYLEPGRPASVIVTRSVSYFDDPGLPVVVDAEVILTWDSISDTLYFNPATIHYESRDTVPVLYNTTYHLSVRDTTGGFSAAAETHFIPPVPLDSITFSWDETYKARVITHFRDPAAQTDFYRITMLAKREKDDLSILLRDQLFDGEDVSWGSSNRFLNKDTIYVRLYHINPEWYDFLLSASRARNGTENPLVEPMNVSSNIQGGLGIFTTKNYMLDSIRVIR